MPGEAANLPEYATLPRAAEHFGIGLKTLRRLVAAGDVPSYSAGTSWPRVKPSEVEAFIRSTRVRVSDHSRARVEERLAHEARNGAV